MGVLLMVKDNGMAGGHPAMCVPRIRRVRELGLLTGRSICCCAALSGHAAVDDDNAGKVIKETVKNPGKPPCPL